MPTVAELDAQIEELKNARVEAMKAERDADLETVKELCRKHGFYPSDLGTALKKRKKRASAAK